MITLTIKKADGSLYWTEYFNDQNSCDAWLASEKTRPYWDKNYMASSVTSVAPVIDPVIEIARKAKIDAASAALAAFDKAKFTAADVPDLIEHILVLQGLK